MTTIDNIPHVCTNCRERHNMCKYDYTSNNCEHFVIGKCYICSIRNDEEANMLCFAEDMSGHGCPNFKE